MATAPSPLAAPSAPASTSFDSIIDAAVDNTPTDTGDTGVDDPVDPEPEVADDPSPEPEVDPVEPEPTEEPEPVDPDDDDLTPDKTSPDGKLLQFSKNKVNKFFAARDFQSKVDQVIPGATPEDIQRHYQRSVATEQMNADFDSGDPSLVGQVANYWLGGNPKSVEAFSVSVLDRLPHVAPQVYSQFENHAVTSKTQSLYEEAVRTGNDKLMLLAQNLDEHLTGKWLTKDDFKTRDPYAEERARFEQERAAFNSDRQREAQQRQQAKTQALDTDVDSLKGEEIVASLKSVEAQLKDTPHWKHIQRDLLEKVNEAITANPTWKRQFDLQKQRAIQDQTGKSAEDLRAMMKGFVGRVAAQHRKDVIGAVTGGVLRANQTAHQQAAQAAAKREPNGSQAPVQRNSHQQELRSAKNYEDAWGVSSKRLK